MKKIVTLFLFFSSALFAVLPPYYQSVKEIRAILDSPELQQNLGSGEMIESIVKTDSGYLVASTKYFLYVDLYYLPQTKPGPVEFELEFQEMQKK